MMKNKWLKSAFLVGAASLMTSVAQAEPLLKDGDRVVFYGDSITEQRLYTRDIQNYFLARYPNMKLRFFNAGWGGDTAPGASRRLERDVLSLNPTVVTLFFGMNDGRYTKVTPDIVQTYRDNLEKIVQALQAKKVRVVVYTPGAVDYDKRPALRDAQYNENLRALGDAAIEIAKKYNCAWADVHKSMLETQNAAKAKDAGASFIPDAVHPDENGHFVMAASMLKGLGAEPMPILLDTTVTPTANGQYTLKAEPSARLPLWIAPGADELADLSGLSALAAQHMHIKGLPAGRYEVSVDNRPVGDWSAAQLANGVSFNGGYSVASKRLYDLIGQKENHYFNIWRNFRLTDESNPQVQNAYLKLLGADEDFQAAIDILRQSPPPSITVKAGMPDNIGPNLALKKTYQVNDPNVYNWGIGGLTDGSWEATPEHAFATGDKDAFPKTATVDLGQTQNLGFVRFGVPGFGSTKTVQISVSPDGQNWKNVGQHQFSLNREEKQLFAFPATPARYVRVTYLDHHADMVGYNQNFSFATELEAYGPKL